jgi:ATP-dependent DNA helicase RecQ
MLQEFFIESRYPPRETVFSIYDHLRQRTEDLLWITYREIGMMGGEKISEIMVASCIKILEDAGAVIRLHRYDNKAEIYLHKNPEMILKTLPPRAKNRKKLIQGLKKLYGEDQLINGIQFLPHELAEFADLSMEALRRSFSQMEAHRETTYIPPFRGRGLRIIKRVEPEELGIDFQTLRVRKASELAKLDQVMAYATAEECRRSFLLRYFGESQKGDTCGACDLCKLRDSEADSKVDGAEPVLAVKILSGVARLKGRYGAGMAAKVLTGSKDRMIIQFGLQRLSTYDLLSDYTQGQVQDWIKELIAKGCIVSRRISMGNKSYPVLELTDRGYRVMSGEELVRLSKPVIEQKPVFPEQPLLQGMDKKVFGRLRELRAGLAREERLPPYCIFHDRTLREMVSTLPKTPEELLRIVGVGEVKLKKYGQSFLRLLNELRDEK